MKMGSRFAYPAALTLGSQINLALNTHTRVGTLIVATVYLQLIQNRYCPSMLSPALCTTHCQRYGSRRIPLAASVVLIVRMEQSTA